MPSNKNFYFYAKTKKHKVKLRKKFLEGEHLNR